MCGGRVLHTSWNRALLLLLLLWKSLEFSDVGGKKIVPPRVRSYRVYVCVSECAEFGVRAQQL